MRRRRHRSDVHRGGGRGGGTGAADIETTAAKIENGEGEGEA
jgi:hypothetical protein